MSHEYKDMEYRLQSLKIAYEVSFKIGNIKDSYDKNDMQIKDDLQDVFTLADMNYQYIINGIHPDMNLQIIDLGK